MARRSGCDLPGSELRLLEHFDVAEPMRVSDIAERLHIDMSTVSLQLRRLRTDGLVVRNTGVADRQHLSLRTQEVRPGAGRPLRCRMSARTERTVGGRPGRFGRQVRA
ncbi:helix-turn-helix domain-containing protein [Nonomuraea angiospora]|uniref:ArsR family transcriptional regulator n=1 Tax=Nonomuraea angiospora TaxID=46172 RepID=A0ABR9MH66_9ACTN|nr:helix-turn-helix domain-containing protein [Nonomuraea angiospora]MBE1592253.1 putative ArsR family transcriptional regulator [Nonomuraea angiospora]